MGRMIVLMLRWLAYVFTGLALLAALFVIFADYVAAHSWYDPFCCSDKDCGPALGADQSPTGLKIEVSPGRWLSVPAGMRLRPSYDADWHVCVLLGQIRCVYTPAGS